MKGGGEKELVCSFRLTGEIAADLVHVLLVPVCAGQGVEGPAPASASTASRRVPCFTLFTSRAGRDGDREYTVDRTAVRESERRKSGEANEEQEATRGARA